MISARTRRRPDQELTLRTQMKFHIFTPPPLKLLFASAPFCCLPSNTTALVAVASSPPPIQQIIMSPTDHTNSHPSINLAKALKQYGSHTYTPDARKPDKKVTCTMVVACNSELFHKKCHPASPSYDPDIDLEILAGELFKNGEIWASRDNHVSVAMADFEKVQGFVSRNEKRTIVCNRVGDAKTDRNYADGDLAAGCSFKIKMTPQVKLAKYLPSKKWSYTDVWTEPVRIDNAHCKHGGQCRPGRQNRVMAVQRAGKYVEKLPDMALFSLCNYLERKGKLPTSHIKDVIEPVWPKAKNVTKHDVFNVPTSSSG